MMAIQLRGKRMGDFWKDLMPYIVPIVVSLATGVSGYVLLRLKMHGTRVQTIGERLLVVEEAERTCQRNLIEEQKARAFDVIKLTNQNAAQQREIDKLTALLGGKA